MKEMEVLGKGTYGKVISCDQHENCAIKNYFGSSYREIFFLRLASGPGIIPCYDSEYSLTHMPKLEILSIDTLRKIPTKICLDLGLSLIRLHDRGIVHADLKPNNFGYLGDKFYLFDFSLSFFIKQDNIYVSQVIPFRAPECRYNRENKNKTRQIDVYSYGIFIYLVFGGDLSHIECLHDCDNAGLYNGTFIPDLANQKLNDLIRWILVSDPEDRPEIREVVKSFCRIFDLCFIPPSLPVYVNRKLPIPVCKKIIKIYYDRYGCYYYQDRKFDFRDNKFFLYPILTQIVSLFSEDLNKVIFGACQILLEKEACHDFQLECEFKSYGLTWQDVNDGVWMILNCPLLPAIKSEYDIDEFSSFVHNSVTQGELSFDLPIPSLKELQELKFEKFTKSI